MSGIIFITSNISMDERVLPSQLAEGVEIRRARDNEVKLLLKEVPSILGNLSMFFVPNNKPGSEEDLYYVLAYNGNARCLDYLGNMALLLRPKINFGPGFTFEDEDQRGKGTPSFFHPLTVFHLLLEEGYNDNIELDVSELHQLKSFYVQLLDNSLPDQDNNLLNTRLYRHCSMLERGSELLTLSFFSIIESLISHKPRASESSDSISHQLRSKIRLLLKRTDRSDLNSKYFGQISHDTLWKKLYSLRSDISHGNRFDFNSKYQALKNQYQINNFLDEVVGELLRLNISEGELLKDLREC